MAQVAIKIVSEDAFYARDPAGFGHYLGQTLAEVRQTFLEHYREHERRDVIRAIVRKLIAAGLNPQTATAAQINAAINASDVEV